MQIKPIKLLAIGIIICQNLNCQTHISHDDENEIYSLIVDDVAKPMPPPPPPPSSSDELKSMPKRVVDSIKQIKLNLAIASNSQILKQSIDKENINRSFHEIIEKLFSEEKTHKLSINKIHSNIGHKISVVDQAKIEDKKRLFEAYDQLIYLSNVEFNDNMDKAVVNVDRVLPGKLSGMSVLYLMKKENGHWVIETIKELSIS